VNGDERTSSTIEIPGMHTLMCIAGANGILMAGGFPDSSLATGVVVYSFDNGVTWKVLTTTPRGVITMTAGVVGGNAGL
jgi:hypothetical protein